MAGPDGSVPEALAGVHDAIVASASPRKALNWLRSGAGAPILAAIAAGTTALTHAALDEHPVQIRQAVPADVPAIAACVEAAFEPYLERMDQAPAPVKADYGELVRRGVVYVAVHDERIVGVGTMWPSGDHFKVDTLAAIPEVRGMGVGAALLAWANEQAIASGCREIRLFINAAMTENLEYYPRKGYTETHRSMDDGYERVHFSRSI